MKKSFLSMAFLSAALQFFVSSAQAELLNIKDAAQKALEFSPGFLTAQKNYEIAKLQTKNNFAGFLPSLDFTSLAGPQRIAPQTVPAGTALISTGPWQSSTSLALSETLYDNGETAKQYHMAQFSEEQLKLQYEKTKGQVLLSVVQSYCDWSFAVLSARFTKKYSDEVERQFKSATAQYYQGNKTRSDYLRFNTQYQRSQLDVITAERQIETNRIALLAVLGLPPTDSATQFVLIEKPLGEKLTAETVSNLDVTDDDLFESKILEIKRRIIEVEIALIYRRDLPQVLLTAGAQYGSSNYIQSGQSWSDNQQTTWNVLLTLKYNFLDWGVRDRNIQIQELQESVGQQDLRSQLIAAEQDLSNFREDQKRLAERQSIATSLEKNEITNFRQFDQDYKAGRITFLDLTTALSELLDAQSKKLRIEFDAKILLSKWKYYKGTLDEFSLEK